MEITVAGKTKEVRAELTVAELINEENVETPEYIGIGERQLRKQCRFC